MELSQTGMDFYIFPENHKKENFKVSSLFLQANSLFICQSVPIWNGEHLFLILSPNPNSKKTLNHPLPPYDVPTISLNKVYSSSLGEILADPSGFSLGEEKWIFRCGFLLFLLFVLLAWGLVLRSSTRVNIWSEFPVGFSDCSLSFFKVGIVSKFVLVVFTSGLGLFEFEFEFCGFFRAWFQLHCSFH